jgi:hypothetical protein
MKLKLRLLEDGETIDWKVLNIKRIEEICYITGIGLDPETLEELKKMGKAKLQDTIKKRELHMVLTND